MNYTDTVLALSTASGPSGFETGATQAAAELLRPYMDEVRVDTMGNLIGLKRSGVPSAKKLLLDAHLDEIGLIVTSIDKGFLHFATIGGVDPRMLPAREVTVMTEPPVFGVVAVMPPHVLSSEDMDKATPIKDMIIDVGMSQKTAEKTIKVGTPIVFRAAAEKLGEDCICGKALDDRACFATLLLALEKLGGKPLPVDLYIMGSTQEELGYRGAKTGVFGIEPDLCVAVDVTHGATPDAPKERTMVFGGGAVIGVGPNMSRKLSDKLASLCEENGIAYQLEASGGETGTNGWALRVSREGVPTAELSLPLKYMHSPVETLKVSDGEAVAELLSRFVLSAGEVL